MATGIFGDVQDSPFQSLARQRTRRIFGVEVPDRALAGIASGLQGYDPQGGFFGNFARGLSGSLQGGMGFDRLAQERAQEEAKMQMAAEQLALQQQRVDMERQRLSQPDGPNVGAIPWYEALPDDDPRKALYRGDATRAPASGGEASQFGKPPWWMAPNAVNPSVRDRLLQLLYDDDSELLGEDTTVLERDAAGYPVRTRKRKIRANTPGVAFDWRTSEMTVPETQPANPLSKYAR